MSNVYWLSDAQMERFRHYFPKSYGRPRVDDKIVLSGIIFINRNGLRWRDAPREYGRHKTLHNLWIRWSHMGVFAKLMERLAAEQADCHHDRRDLSEGAPHGLKLGGSKGAWKPDRTHQARHEHQASRRHRREGPTRPPLPDCRSGQLQERLPLSASSLASRRPATTPTDFASLCRKAKFGNAFRLESRARQRTNTTSEDTEGATVSRVSLDGWDSSISFISSESVFRNPRNCEAEEPSTLARLFRGEFVRRRCP
ncbi:transposase [Pseudoroseicyclus sp. CLL3-39]|uniref:Transposase n=1 Tax=Pseudoroseicyclus tamaricis TaxID=2705421 RepID=A0A6B2JT84_9RHOB|nr:transposase [Pseudoroseicyclus tamaricis]